MKTASSPSVAQELLARWFGFDRFRPGQEAVIERLLDGQSAVAVFPTGGGKSLCYQLPALAFDEGVTVVVSPLIALMKDQIDYLTGRGIEAARLDSSLTAAEVRSISERLSARTLRLLYVSPERFHNERFLDQIGRAPIALFAVDEAHCISEWGHNFRPDYLTLAATARRLDVRRVLALTATATPQVVDDIRAAFEIPPDGATVTGFYRPNLELWTTAVSATEREDVLLERIRSRPPGPTIVYVTLQKTAERVAQRLLAAGLPAAPYHAGLDDDERSRVQDTWMRSGRGIVVATIAFGMGVDKADVRYVYHFNLPKSLESYSQEIGRAGRDGAPSTVELLACADDLPTIENFVYGDTPDAAAVGGLVQELLAQGPEFAVALYDLSVRHDIRQLVVRTILTYLELEGVLRQGTPFYAGYEFKALNQRTPTEVAQHFPEPLAAEILRVFGAARRGRIWHALDPEVAATTLGVERRRVVRILDVLQEQGLIELRVSDARQRFYRCRDHEDAAALTELLVRRFQAREDAELARLERVLKLVGARECQVNALTAYFGERRATPCGHCSVCRTGESVALAHPASAASAPLPRRELMALRTEYPAALGTDRQLARFLCGLSSPASSKARLGRHIRFGCRESVRFAQVLRNLQENKDA